MDEKDFPKRLECISLQIEGHTKFTKKKVFAVIRDVSLIDHAIKFICFILLNRFEDAPDKGIRPEHVGFILGKGFVERCL